MAFLHLSITSASHKGNPKPVSVRRRKFFQLAGKVAVGLLIAQPLKTAADEVFQIGQSSKWKQEHLCENCGGRGRQTCSFCDGAGTLTIGDSIVQSENVCPNCEGNGSIRCPACIGLGLADVSGVLRNGKSHSHYTCYLNPNDYFYPSNAIRPFVLFSSAVRKGTLRMLRSGSYEILDCSAFPACDIYGIERRSQL